MRIWYTILILFPYGNNKSKGEYILKDNEFTLSGKRLREQSIIGLRLLALKILLEWKEVAVFFHS